ncbi:hypothetical protein ACF0H5_022901 [Mactra antiquata]
MNVSANQSNEFSTHGLLEELNYSEFLRLIPTLVFMLIIALVGIPGNGLVCYIYRFQYRNSSSKWFIFFLACVDLVFCCFIIPCDIITLSEQFTFTDPAWCKFVTFTTLWAIFALGLTLVIVTIDRFRKVCKPLGWQINFEKGRILCVCAVSVSFVISLPVFVFYDIHEFQLHGYDVIASECSFRKSTDEFNTAFIYVLFGMVLFSCALITICVLYCFIGKEIKQHIQKEKIKRHISLTASMARANDHVRPVLSLRPISSLFAKRNVRLGGGTQVPVKKTKSANLTAQKKKVNFGASKSVTIGEVNNVVKFDVATTDQSNVSQDQPPTSPKPRISSEATSSEADDTSKNILSDDDTCDVDFKIPKRRLTRAQKTKSKRIRRARARKATFSMFLISIAFVLSYLPFLCLLLARSVISDFDEAMSETERAVYKFFLRSYFLNYAINPFIYGISDSKFRQSCKDVLFTLRGKITSVCSRNLPN